jgi:hypothetical protein
VIRRDCLLLASVFGVLGLCCLSCIALEGQDIGKVDIWISRDARSSRCSQSMQCQGNEQMRMRKRDFLVLLYMSSVSTDIHSLISRIRPSERQRDCQLFIVRSRPLFKDKGLGPSITRPLLRKICSMTSAFLREIVVCSTELCNTVNWCSETCVSDFTERVLVLFVLLEKLISRSSSSILIAYISFPIPSIPFSSVRVKVVFLGSLVGRLFDTFLLLFQVSFRVVHYFICFDRSFQLDTGISGFG